MPENLMLKFFKDRKHLEFIRNYVSYSEAERPHLSIAHPAILATFVGYLKFQMRKSNATKEVFFRGQTENHQFIIPNLLRGDDFGKINNLSKAYEKLKEETKKLFKSKRFKDETIDNLFQHYGIKSKTLDLVDNIYIAIWFAVNTWKNISDFNNLCTYEQSKKEYGWIYFLAVEGPSKAITDDLMPSPGFTGFCDLRKYHSSLSARLHCQHGITYYRDSKGQWTVANRCFDNLLIATVKFPNSEEFKMNGTIFTKEFLFPNSEIDNTYKLLSSKKFSSLLTKIEKEFRLEKGDLGTIWTYDF